MTATLTEGNRSGLRAHVATDGPLRVGRRRLPTSKSKAPKLVRSAETVRVMTDHLTPAERRVLTVLIERLLEERDGAVAEILSVLQLRVPEYRAITDRRSLDVVRGGIRYVYDVGLATLDGGRDLSSSEVTQLRELGRERATQGLALESVMRGVRVAIEGVMGLVQAKLARIEAAPGVRASVGLHVGTHLIRMAEAFSTAIEHGFRTRRSPTPAEPADSDPEARQGEHTLRATLEGSAPGSARIGQVELSRASALVFLTFDVSPDHMSPDVLHAVRLRVAASTKRYALCILQPRGQRRSVVAVLLEVEAPKEWRRIRSSLEALVLGAHDLGALVALQPAVHSASSLHQAWQAGTQSFPVGELLARGRVIDADELRFLRIVSSDVAAVSEFVESVLGRLLRETAYRREVLAETIAAYFTAQCRVKTAAARLGCNERTVRERLDRFANLTQLDLGKDRLDINLALSLRRVWERAKSTSTVAAEEAQD